MTDAQLVVATLWLLFLIGFFAALYFLDFVMSRVEQIIGRPLEKIEERLSDIDTGLCEANRHRERLNACSDRIAERL